MEIGKGTNTRCCTHGLNEFLGAVLLFCTRLITLIVVFLQLQVILKDASLRNQNITLGFHVQVSMGQIKLCRSIIQGHANSNSNDNPVEILRTVTEAGTNLSANVLYNCALLATELNNFVTSKIPIDDSAA